VDIGFNPRNLVVFRVSPQLNRYEDKRIPALHESLLERLRATPGVRAATLAHMGLLTGGQNTGSIYVQGRSYGQDEGHSIHRLVIAANFFETLEMPLLLGRGFTDADHDTAPTVAVISQVAARRYFGDATPIGRRFGYNPQSNAEFEVVGVLRDAKYATVRDEAPPTMYVPYRQSRVPMVVFSVRTAGDPVVMVPALRDAVRQVDPDLPLMDVSTQAEQLDRRLTPERLFARAYTLFGGLTLLLASIGLFGVLSYSVARRSREIGIRMALGARPPEVVRLVLRESLVLVTAGLVGLMGAGLVARLLTSQLFGLAPWDPTSWLVASVVLVGASAIAGYLPARRAARVDPMVALRCE
jgi:predicted permease